MDQVTTKSNRTEVFQTHPWAMVDLLTQNKGNEDKEKNWDTMTQFIEYRYKLPWKNVLSKRRYIGIVYLRSLAVYWFLNCYDDTDGVVLRWIAIKMGWANHTTVMHSRDSFQEKLDINAPVPSSDIYRDDYHQPPEDFQIEFPDGIETTGDDYTQFKHQIRLWL